MNKRILDYSGKKVFIGIDVHRLTYAVTAICEGEVVKRWSMAAYPAGLVEALLKYFQGAELISAYEAGFSGFALHRILVGAGIGNIVIHAAAIEVAAHDKVKTDKRDSLKIAGLLAVGRLKAIRIPSIEEERRRLITRTRTQLVGTHSAYMNRIRMRLHQFGLIDPRSRARMSLREVERYLAQDLSPELRCVIEVYRDMLVAIRAKIRALQAEARKQSKEDRLIPVYRSVPGFGEITSRELANELGDLQQFSSEKALRRFTGLTPSEFSSGENRHLGHITRQGSSRIRALLVEAAWFAIREDPTLNEAFVRIALRAGKKRAIVAIAAKLICKVRACFRDGKLYEISEPLMASAA